MSLKYPEDFLKLYPIQIVYVVHGSQYLGLHFIEKYILVTLEFKMWIEYTFIEVQISLVTRW